MEGMERRRGGGEVPPPYRAIRPVRAKLCLSGPTFSTACWAMTSPVAKSTCPPYIPPVRIKPGSP